MSAIEYSLIFLSILIGYVVTVAMVGWGKLIKHYDFNKFSLNYLLWSLILFLYLLFIWFWTFSYHLGYLNSYFWFTLIMVRPLLIYFSFEVLIPENHESNLEEHFLKVRKKFFLILTILWSYEIFLTLLQGHSLNTSRGMIYFANIPISVSFILTKNKTYISAATIISFLIMVIFVCELLVSQYYGIH